LLDSADTHTRSGAVVGTPSYMAPEQASGKSGGIGPAADVYALGAILYELLTGRPPFQADSALDTLMRVVSDEVPPPRQFRATIGRDLEAICLKCLEKEPARRYASAAELANDLERYRRGEVVQARPLGPVGRLARWAQKRPALAATLAALAVFYADHLVLLSIDEAEGGDFHWFVTRLLGCWALGAIALQWLMNRPGWRWVATYGWAAFDVVMFTLLLLRVEGVKSSLLVCYPLLIAAAALRFRLGLVWFVTALCTISYAVLLADARWRRPEANLMVEFPIAVIFFISLVLMGVMMTLLLRRFRLALAQER
jgi:serine/threonine-protein kinase